MVQPSTTKTRNRPTPQHRPPTNQHPIPPTFPPHRPSRPPVAKDAELDTVPVEDPAPEDPSQAEVTDAVGAALAQGIAAPMIATPLIAAPQAAPATERAMQLHIETSVTLPATGMTITDPKETPPKAKTAPRDPLQDAAQASTQAPTQSTATTLPADSRAARLPEAAQDKPDSASDLPDDLTPTPQLQAQPVQAQPTDPKTALLRTDLPGWEKVLADRIAADLSDDGSEIELTLSPEKLGPLKIRLELADGQAQVKIVTATPEAAKLFTETQHRLSEHLARAGLDLGAQTADSRQSQDDRPAPRGLRATEFMARAGRREAEATAPTRRASAGLVNLMA